MAEDKGIVCVTGGTGYIASWLIMKLLQHGYSVRTTVRSHHITEKKDLSYLRNLPEASKRLKIFHADLDEEGSFATVIKGCIGVFHLAHPMDVQGKEEEEVVTKRAVEGTRGILKACLASKTVKRVIYTSSASTILFKDYKNRNVDVVDEDVWSDLEFCRSNNLVSSSYLISKILTEKTVLKFGEENGLKVVSLVLPLVVGPFICPKIPSSVYIALAMIFGDKNQYQYLTNSYMVHIEDATRALIYLFEYANANGRYICSSQQISFHQMYQFLSRRYPQYHITLPQETKETKNSEQKFSAMSSRKLLETGFKFMYGINEMYDGAIDSCNDKGILLL